MIYVLGGGKPLNFRVLGGTTQPASPKENDIWVNTSTAISSWDFTATEPHRRSSNKNLIVYPYLWTQTGSQSGITYTVNSDGTISANGTASANAYCHVSNTGIEKGEIILEAGTYTLSGCTNGGSNYGLNIAYSHDNWATTLQKKVASGSVTFTIDKPAKARFYININSGTTASNLVFKPQLEKGSSATSFVKGDATGHVWFSTDTTGNVAYNALKKNGIQVYLLSAKQYVSGAWTTKTAKVYQNGAWVDLWNGVLLDPNVTSNDYTGGWIGDSSIAIFAPSERTYKEATATYGSNNVAVSMSGKAEGSYRTVKKVDVSGFNTLTVNVSSATAPNGVIIVFISNKLNIKAWTESVAKTPIVNQTTSGAKTVTVDISAVSGEHYIGVALAAYGTDAVTANITKISLI